MPLSQVSRNMLKDRITGLFLPNPFSFPMFVMKHFPSVAAMLPIGASLEMMVDSFVNALESMGLVNATLFEAIAESFPGQEPQSWQPVKVELGLCEPTHRFMPPELADELANEAIQQDLHKPSNLAALRVDPHIAPHIADQFDDWAKWLRISVHTVNRLRGPLGQPDALLRWLDWAIQHASSDASFRTVRNELALLRQEGPPTGDAKTALERIVNRLAGFVDVNAYIQRIQSAKNCVGCVVVNGLEVGTGFLVGRDLFLTANHVILGHDGQHVSPETVKVRFDYDAQGKSGTVHSLVSEDWLLAHRPHSPADSELDPKPSSPTQTELDYALLRLATPAGDDDLGSGRRQWIRLPLEEAPYTFPINSGLVILQHPEGRALTMALNSQAVVKMDGHGRRVRYRINTEPGSSGSPVFSLEWKLVALHHAGDPNYSHVALYNQGVPIALILADINEAVRHELVQASI